MIDRAFATARIQALLEGITDPQFLQVFAGEPLGLPLGGPYCCWWYVGDQDATEGRMTLGNVMVWEVFRIGCYWQRTPERTILPQMEAEIWSVSRKVQEAFHGDAMLNDTATTNVADLDIRVLGVDYGAFPLQSPTPALYRSLEFDLRLKDLEAEAIHA